MNVKIQFRYVYVHTRIYIYIYVNLKVKHVLKFNCYYKDVDIKIIDFF